MGTYSDVNCTKLKNATDTAIEELKKKSQELGQIHSSLNDSMVLPGEIRKKVLDTINKINSSKSNDVVGSLNNLMWNLNKLNNVLEGITAYQKIDKYIDRHSEDSEAVDSARESLDKLSEQIKEVLNKKRGFFS